MLWALLAIVWPSLGVWEACPTHVGVPSPLTEIEAGAERVVVAVRLNAECGANGMQQGNNLASNMCIICCYVYVPANAL